MGRRSSPGLRSWLLASLCLAALGCFGCQSISHGSLRAVSKPDQERHGNLFLQMVQFQPEILNADHVKASVGVRLPKDHEFTEGFPLHFHIGLQDSLVKEGELAHPEKELPISFELKKRTETDAVLTVELEVAYCTTKAPKVCKFKSVKAIQPISFAPDGKSRLDLYPQVVDSV